MCGPQLSGRLLSAIHARAGHARSLQLYVQYFTCEVPMTALLTGLASLLVFGSVILVHELGHFMARAIAVSMSRNFPSALARACGPRPVTERPILSACCRWAAIICSAPCLTRRTTRRTRAGRAHRRPPRSPAKPRFSRWSSAARNLRMPPPGSAFLSRSAVR